MPKLRYRAGILALAFGLGLSAPAFGEPGEIKGQDVKGDREKSANDGFSQSPVPREESAGKDSANPGGESTGENRDRSVPATKTGDGSGDDPSKPLDQRAPGPSGQDPARPSK